MQTWLRIEQLNGRKRIHVGNTNLVGLKVAVIILSLVVVAMLSKAKNIEDLLGF